MDRDLEKLENNLIRGCLGAVIAVVVILALVIGIYWSKCGYQPGTIFALGYSEVKFEQVKPGMSKAQVLSLLGPPLKEEAGAFDTWWVYSRQRNDNCFWLVRNIEISAKTNKVTHKEAMKFEP